MTLTPSDVKPLEKWEDMCWNTGGANEETLLVEASKVADELETYKRKTIHGIFFDDEKIEQLIKTLRGGSDKVKE